MVTDHGVYLRERYIALSAAADSFFLKRFLLRLVHLVGRACYTVADQVSPVCEHNARWELKMGVTADRVRTVYNGIDTERFAPPETEPERARPTVVTAARAFPLKDIETLIRACDVTRRRVPDVHFVVYGDDAVDAPYTDRCLALIDELGVRDHFTFAGFHADPVTLPSSPPPAPPGSPQRPRPAVRPSPRPAPLAGTEWVALGDRADPVPSGDGTGRGGGADDLRISEEKRTGCRRGGGGGDRSAPSSPRPLSSSGGGAVEPDDASDPVRASLLTFSSRPGIFPAPRTAPPPGPPLP